MVILDEIRMPNQPPLLNVIGGSSTFVTLGLRLFATDSLTPGCLVLAGNDLPSPIREELLRWHMQHLVVLTSPDQPSSRGLLEYADSTFGPKTFEYTTTPLRATPDRLAGTRLLTASAFHFFGTPDEVMVQVPLLLSLRRKEHAELPPPLIVWEPIPSSCTPGNRAAFQDACKLVDVFSPNHLELAALFADDEEPKHANEHLLVSLERLGNTLTDAGVGSAGNGTVVVRAGADGALALQRDRPSVRVPAYYAPGAEQVVDPTGAGNAFLGGYVVGLLREGVVREALCYGAVAASFALEQIGLPGCEVVDCGGWKRLEEFRGRIEG
jgi:sugar/nucleoside kinase (ribokinase family)